MTHQWVSDADLPLDDPANIDIDIDVYNEATSLAAVKSQEHYFDDVQSWPRRDRQ